MLYGNEALSLDQYNEVMEHSSGNRRHPFPDTMNAIDALILSTAAFNQSLSALAESIKDIIADDEMELIIAVGAAPHDYARGRAGAYDVHIDRVPSEWSFPYLHRLMVKTADMMSDVLPSLLQANPQMMTVEYAAALNAAWHSYAQMSTTFTAMYRHMSIMSDYDNRLRQENATDVADYPRAVIRAMLNGLTGHIPDEADAD